MRNQIIGSGFVTGENLVTNDQLAQIMDTFDACSLSIQLSKCLCLLALTSSLQGNKCFAPANGQGTLPGLGAV